MRPRSLDILAAAAVAILTLIVAFSGLRNPAEQDGLPVWFMPFGALMVLFLPGYAISRALLPQQDHSMRLLVSLGVSVGIAILGGLVLHFTVWGLSTESWAVWLSSMTLLGCLGTLLYREGLPADRTPLPRLEWKIVASLALSTGLIVAAIWIARSSALRAGTTFTQLWAIPESANGQYIVHIGVRNQETRAWSYELYIESRGRTLYDWPDVRLEPGEQWETTLVLEEMPAGPIEILLFRADAPDRPYRRTRLTPATFEALSLTPVRP